MGNVRRESYTARPQPSIFVIDPKRWMSVTAPAEPSVCGKSTLLRCFNDMNALYDHVRIEAEIRLFGHNILRRHAGARLVLATTRITTDHERIGDEAKKIAAWSCA